MATAKSKSTGKKSSSKKAKGINPLHRPADMDIRQWQIALRKQTAEKEFFGINQLLSSDGRFIVTSGKSGRAYKVNYFGPDSTANRCECMDFKTSRLGTCKHIEAISLAKKGRYARRKYSTAGHTYVYVDYPAGRIIKIHKGEYVSPELENHISTLFDSNDEIKDLLHDPYEFIRVAKRIDETFEWEEDALKMLIEQRDKKQRKEIIAKKYAASLFDGLLKTTLHPYQADGVRFAFTGGRTINADEMGLGKTVQAIATAELLRHENLISSVIIICPTSLKYQWLAEIKKFTDSAVTVVEGNLMKRKEQLAADDAFYKICSFHAMSNTIKGGFIPNADMIIYDELQRLKNKETQMGKQLRKLQSQYVMALSGTPLENKLDELYSVTQFVDQYALGPYYQFTSDTTLTDEIGKIVGYRNLHIVAEKLQDTLIRRKKADVKLQMPARTDTNLFVPMTKEQQTIHDEYQNSVSILVHKWRSHKFLSEADRKRLLLFLSMMRMVCDSTFILDQKTRFDTKIDETMEIIGNLLDNADGKVVIFSQWERMLRILAGQLENKKIDFCFLHGGVPSVKRKTLIDRFRDDEQCRIFLSTDAGATGLNLQSASLLINLDLPWNPAVLEQRIARIYRLGQINPVQIINMVARDTIEERMLATLRFKSDLASGILDGGDDAVFFDNNKFDKIVDMVDGIVNEEETIEEEDNDIVSDDTENTDDTKEKCTEPEETIATPQKQISTVAGASNATSSTDQPHKPSSAGDTQAKPSDTMAHTPDDVRKTVADGLSALSKITEMLQTPESTKALVDAIVTEDPDTGKTTLNIPVPDKSTVMNLFTAFSSFLKQK